LRVPHVPARGDVVWLDFTPHSGHEQAGRRPAVCISPDVYNHKVGLALFCPVTLVRKFYPFEVVLPESVPICGVVLADHVKNLDWRSRRSEYVCTLPPETMAEILGKLKALL